MGWYVWLSSHPCSCLWLRKIEAPRSMVQGASKPRTISWDLLKEWRLHQASGFEFWGETPTMAPWDLMAISSWIWMVRIHIWSIQTGQIHHKNRTQAPPWMKSTDQLAAKHIKFLIANEHFWKHAKKENIHQSTNRNRLNRHTHTHTNID